MEAFSAALEKLVSDYVETPSDARKAIDALYDRIDALEGWIRKQDSD